MAETRHDVYSAYRSSAPNASRTVPGPLTSLNACAIPRGLYPRSCSRLSKSGRNASPALARSAALAASRTELSRSGSALIDRAYASTAQADRCRRSCPARPTLRSRTEELAAPWATIRKCQGGVVALLLPSIRPLGVSSERASASACLLGQALARRVDASRSCRRQLEQAGRTSKRSCSTLRRTRGWAMSALGQSLSTRAGT